MNGKPGTPGGHMMVHEKKWTDFPLSPLTNPEQAAPRG